MGDKSQGVMVQESRLWTKDFILICLTNLLIFSGFQMLMPTLPKYVQQWGVDRSVLGLVTGIFTVSAVLVRPLVGRELDRQGRRGIYLLGLATFSLAVLGYRWAPGLVVLLAIRLFHGVTWGATTTAAGTIVADIIPPWRRGEGMGYFGMFSNLAMALAPALGLSVATLYGFPLLFLISASLAFASFLMASLIKVPPVDSTEGAPRPALFEIRALPPSLVAFFLTISYGGIVTFLQLYAEQRGITNIGLFFTVYAVTLMVVRPLAGILYDRRGPNIVVIPGLVMGIMATALLSQAVTMGTFLLAGVLYGLGFGATQPTLQAVTISLVPPGRRGAANGTFFSSFDLGIGLGAVLLGAIAQKAGYSVMYLAASAGGVTALLVYLGLRSKFHGLNPS